MHKEIVVRCPNCGSFAQRFLTDHLPVGVSCPQQQVIQTECPSCDYFMVMCANGQVPLPNSFATTSVTSKRTLDLASFALY